MEFWQIGLILAAAAIYILVTAFMAGNFAAEEAVVLIPRDYGVGPVDTRFEHVRSLRKAWLLAALWPIRLVLGLLGLLLELLTWPFRAAYRLGRRDEREKDLQRE